MMWSKIIKKYVGTMPCDKQVSLTQYMYDDGTTNHWLFRDRLGRPANPQNQQEVDYIIKEWRLAEVEV